MIKQLFRAICPYGIVAWHQRQFALAQLGLAGGSNIECALDACRYELWPPFLRKNAPAWTLVDVGANEGGFLSSVLQLVSPKEIFVFEPQPACQGALKGLLHGRPGSHLHACAVGAEQRTLEFRCMANSKMSSALDPLPEVAASYKDGDFRVVETIEVPVVRLDDALPEHLEIDLLKVDVQGYEMQVFCGAEQTLARTRAILLEINYSEHYKGSASFDNVYRFLSSRGFRVFGISAPYSGAEGPLWADAVFVKDHTLRR